MTARELFELKMVEYQHNDFDDFELQMITEAIEEFADSVVVTYCGDGTTKRETKECSNCLHETTPAEKKPCFSCVKIKTKMTKWEPKTQQP